MKEILQKFIDYVAAIAVVVGILIMIWLDFALGLKLIITAILIVSIPGALID